MPYKPVKTAHSSVTHNVYKKTVPGNCATGQALKHN